MGNRAGILLLFALLSGSLAAFLAFTFIRSPAAPAAIVAERESVPVVVVARDVSVGSTLTAEDLRVVDWPGAALPAGFATSPEEVVGLGVVRPMAMNEPVLPAKLASREYGRGLQMLLDTGYRAISFPVNDVSAVAGWAQAGARVDILVTLNQVRNEVEPVTQIVLNNVLVIGNNQNISQDQNGQSVQSSVITVAVTPIDAEKVAMAQTNGRLHLALRNPMDQDTVITPGVRESQLLSRVASAPAPRTGGAPAPAPRPSRATITMIRGTEKTEVQPGGGE